MAMLSQLGLVQLNNSAGGFSQGSADAVQDGADGAAQGGADGVREQTSKEPFREPHQYTESEVKSELKANPAFSVVVDETQRRLGKILSPDDLLRLLGIYDSLRLPPEVILQLITHCIIQSSITGDGRAPSMRYIEKAAFKWEREGIFTLEKAEEYLKEFEARKSVQGEIKKILQIRDREFSATEKHFVDGWIDMGFQNEAIAIAYDRAVVKTGKLSIPYMDGIMKNWHSKGIHTAEQVMEKDGGQKRNTTGANAYGTNNNPAAQKHGEPNLEEMERMQRVLNKIKEE
jgi:DNA replication protein DnaD